MPLTILLKGWNVPNEASIVASSLCRSPGRKHCALPASKRTRLPRRSASSVSGRMTARSRSPPICTKTKISITHHSRVAYVDPGRISSCLHELRNTGSTESEASMLPWSMHALSSQMLGAAEANLCSKSLAYLSSPLSRQEWDTKASHSPRAACVTRALSPVSALDTRSAAARLLSGSTRNISLAVRSA
eukprot:scaffold9336_cov77-Phaeocystis_antarctica.AAC.4